MARILVVDDYTCVRELVAHELRDQGYQTETANDEESAREAIVRSKPDLVVMELLSRQELRWDLLQWIKRRDPTIPVIIHSKVESCAGDPRLGQADSFVIKSCDLGELKRAVARVWKGRGIASLPKEAPENREQNTAHPFAPSRREPRLELMAT
jgi:two-component system, response regulator, stage 0 sporulation protein F